ncbi:hypothetical protein ZWY2020_021934 [Hordeum vulgare]|nr:hypothetical protein ZWY2020_021934 [Hordeum vulgare]
MQLDDPHCPNSNQQVEETLLHLLFESNFARECWNTLLRGKKRGTRVYDETMLAIDMLPKDFVAEIVILACMNIWIQRNGEIFKAQQQSIQSWRFYLKRDLKLRRFKIKESHAQAFAEWIDNNF